MAMATRMGNKKGKRMEVAAVVGHSSSITETNLTLGSGMDATYLNIFTNNVILDSILQHLTNREMLFLSQTSRPICSSIRLSNKLSKVCILLSPRNITKGNDLENILHRFPTRWRHCLLEVDGWTKAELGSLHQILTNVTTLELFSRVLDKSYKSLRSISAGDLVTLITSVTLLKSLSFHVDILCDQDFTSIFTPELVAHLHNLKELKLTAFIPRVKDDIPSDFFVLAADSGRSHNYEHSTMREPRLYRLTNHIKVFTSFAPFKNLTSICIQNIHVEENRRFFSSGEPVQDLFQNFFSLILAHKDTLERLDVDQALWCNEGITKTTFPKLKYLKADSGDFNSGKIGKFMDIQPLLETIQVDSCKNDGSTFNGWRGGGVKIFKAIQQRSGSNLRTLKMKLPTAHGDTYKEQAAWNFLQDCKTLDEISVEFHAATEILIYTGAPCRPVRHAQGITGTDVTNILENIHGNIRHVKISGVKLEIMTPSISRRLVELLPEFTQLRSLDLWKSYNALDNAALTVISASLAHLRLFAFSHCDKITDYGITGTPQDKKKQKPATGIQSLTHLEVLRIALCPNISKDAFLHSVAFIGLRKLTLLNAESQDPFSDEGVLQLVIQNPSLEEFDYNNTTLVPRQKTFVNTKLSELGKKSIRFLQLKKM